MARYISSDESEKPTTKNTLTSKVLIQIRQRNQKLYRQAESKRIQHHQTSLTTNAKGTSLGGGGGGEATTGNKKTTNGKFSDKDKHKVIVGNHPHTRMISKQATMRR